MKIYHLLLIPEIKREDILFPDSYLNHKNLEENNCLFIFETYVTSHKKPFPPPTGGFGLQLYA